MLASRLRPHRSPLAFYDARNDARVWTLFRGRVVTGEDVQPVGPCFKKRMLSLDESLRFAQKGNHLAFFGLAGRGGSPKAGTSSARRPGKDLETHRHREDGCTRGSGQHAE